MLPELQECLELPLQAWWGTLYLRSAAGTTLEFYSYMDPAFKFDIWDYEEPQTVITVTVHDLQRADRAHLRQWRDFTLYEHAQSMLLIARLRRAGFRIYVAK